MVTMATIRSYSLLMGVVMVVVAVSGYGVLTTGGEDEIVKKEREVDCSSSRRTFHGTDDSRERDTVHESDGKRSSVQ